MLLLWFSYEVGEMFSTANLLSTLTHHFDCQARLHVFVVEGQDLEQNAEEGEISIIDHIKNRGVVLLPYGAWAWFGQHEAQTVLHHLHPTFWWGLLLTVFGGFYTFRFRPRSGKIS